MSPPRGRWGEQVACRFLERKGYVLIDRNWRGPQGELDLVMSDRGRLVFVEVKARGGERFGSPEEAVTAVKRRRLRHTARAYLEARGLLESDWRLDVVAVHGGGPAGYRIEHYPDAIDDEADPQR